MRRFYFFCALAALLLSTVTCFSQQAEVTQFSLISGYSYLSTSSLNLAQHGFNGDIAQNVRPWLSIGFDFSTFTGYSTLVPATLIQQPRRDWHSCSLREFQRAPWRSLTRPQPTPFNSDHNSITAGSAR
jgi:hypothetical protein